MVVEGYIIVQPLNQWETQPYNVHAWTFGNSAGEAWFRFLGPRVPFIDQSTHIQRWFDRGYRVKKVRMEIE